MCDTPKFDSAGHLFCSTNVMAVAKPATATGTFLRDDNTWQPPPAAALPSGLLVISLTACPSGFTEVSALNGKMLRGTLAANGDVGTTGGTATITPAGTVSTPAFIGTSAQVTSATSAGTPAGTNATGTVTPTGSIATGTFANVATATSGNCAATNIAAGTGSTTACKATAPNLTVPAEGHTGTLTFAGSSSTTSAEIFTGSALATHTHTLTPAGTISAPTFTGNAVDPSPPYTKVIFCSVN